MEFKENGQFNQELIAIKDRIKREVESHFVSGEKKLYRDVLNFWPIWVDFFKSLPKEQLTEQLELLGPLSYYQESFLERGKREVESLRASSGEKTAQDHDIYYKEELSLVMKLSDKNLIIQYNELVDRYNKDLAQIKKEKDINTLCQYVQKVISIVDGKQHH